MGAYALLATAFAFKAQSFSKHVVFFNNGTGMGCTVPLIGKVIIGIGGTQRASTTVVPVNCPFLLTEDEENG